MTESWTAKHALVWPCTPVGRGSGFSAQAAAWVDFCVQSRATCAPMGPLAAGASAVRVLVDTFSVLLFMRCPKEVKHHDDSCWIWAREMPRASVLG